MAVSWVESQKHTKLYSYSPKREFRKGDQKMAEEWKEVVRGNVFAFQQVGDNLEGVVVSRKKSTQYENMVYDIETKEGLKTIFGTTILDSLMGSIQDNQPVKIEYVGEVKTGTGRLAKNFKVFTKGTS